MNLGAVFPSPSGVAPHTSQSTYWLALRAGRSASPPNGHFRHCFHAVSLLGSTVFLGCVRFSLIRPGYRPQLQQEDGQDEVTRSRHGSVSCCGNCGDGSIVDRLGSTGSLLYLCEATSRSCTCAWFVRLFVRCVCIPWFLCSHDMLEWQESDG